MYHFLYWFFYEYYKRAGIRSSLLASCAVGLALVIHTALLYTIIRHITGWSLSYPLKNFEYGERKYILMVFFLPILLLLDFLYYRKKRLEILATYKGQNISDKRNIVKTLLIIVVPVFLNFWLLL